MNFLKKKNGQSTTEYILIVALIALAVFAAIKFLGSATKEGFKKAGKEVEKAVR